jgi:hypothetical protein
VLTDWTSLPATYGPALATLVDALFLACVCAVVLLLTKGRG